jgi:PAS domain-containing protein
MEGKLIILIPLTLVVLALVILLVWRERRAASMKNAANELDQILRTGKFAARVPAGGGGHELADTANRLLEHIAVRDLQIRERERTLNGLLGGLHEAVAVHRESIVFANTRFIALAGARGLQNVVGRSLAEIVPLDYRELVGEHLRRNLAGETSPERLEIELQPSAEQTARVELSVARMDYQGAPALLLTMIEMGPRAQTATAQRARATAWQTLDSIGETIITVDVNECIGGNPARRCGRTSTRPPALRARELCR